MRTKRKKKLSRKKRIHPMKRIALAFYKNRLANFLKSDPSSDFVYTPDEAKRAARQSTLDAMSHDISYKELQKLLPK